ncbi:MAG: AAA family ATPase [Armatimonadota bacterium]
MALSKEHLVHQQILKWEAEARARREQTVVPPPPKAYPFVTISREAGSLGTQAAAIVAQALGWQCLDKEIVEYVARDAKVTERLIDSLDEKAKGYVEAWMSSFLHKHHFESSDYIRHLAKVLRAFVQHEPAVIVGRGAHLILSSLRDKGLAVRVTAPLEIRIKRYAKDQGVTEQEAAQRIRNTDRARAQFFQSFLGRQFEDMMQFDLVINTERLDAQQTANIILCAVRERGLDRFK